MPLAVPAECPGTFGGHVAWDRTDGEAYLNQHACRHARNLCSATPACTPSAPCRAQHGAPAAGACSRAAVGAAATLPPCPCDSGSRLRPLPLPLAQVKVKRRGSDTKYVAQVLAMGVECDIALLTGKRARRPGLLPTRQGVPAVIPAGVIARSAPAGQRRQRRPLVPQLVHSRGPEDSPATLLPSSSLVSELLVRGHTARATRRAQRCCRSWAPPPLRRLHSGRNI